MQRLLLQLRTSRMNSFFFQCFPTICGYIVSLIGARPPIVILFFLLFFFWCVRNKGLCKGGGEVHVMSLRLTGKTSVHLVIDGGYFKVNGWRQFLIEVRKISRRLGSRRFSKMYAEFGHFMWRFCRERWSHVPTIKTQPFYCSVIILFRDHFSVVVSLNSLSQYALFFVRLRFVTLFRILPNEIKVINWLLFPLWGKNRRRKPRELGTLR